MLQFQTKLMFQFKIHQPKDCFQKDSLQKAKINSLTQIIIKVEGSLEI